MLSLVYCRTSSFWKGELPSYPIAYPRLFPPHSNFGLQNDGDGLGFCPWFLLTRRLRAESLTGISITGTALPSVPGVASESLDWLDMTVSDRRVGGSGHCLTLDDFLTLFSR